MNYIEKALTANNQGFVGLAKPTMKPLLNGTDCGPFNRVAFNYGVIVVVFLRILRGFCCLFFFGHFFVNFVYFLRVFHHFGA